MTLFVLPAGGFFVLGCVIALVNKIANREPPKSLGCSACPNREGCPSAADGGCKATEEAKEGNN